MAHRGVRGETAVSIVSELFKQGECIQCSMPFLTFHGGVGEVGGNKILLEDKDVRVWFDFGQSFSYGDDYFVDWLTPRWIMGCKDHFEFNILPKIPGLYSRKMLIETDLKYVKPRFDAVFLSHAHFDHIAHIEFLDEDIPIHLGATAKTFIECQEETTNRTDYGEHRYKTFRTGTKIKIGHLEVEPIHVDHSIPAAYGFIIHTSRGAVAYTGDIRMHGPKAEMTAEFMEKTGREKPIVLISEGTRVAPKDKRKNLTEEEVLDGATSIAKKCSGLVLATSYGRDIDRFKTFYEAARRSGRELVIPPRVAYLMSRLSGRMETLNVRDDKGIRVYFKRKKSGTYDDKDYYNWERPFLNRLITPDEIRKKQAKYLVHLSVYDFTEIIDIRPSAGSDFIYSMSEPFSEEDINYEVMHNWLKHFKLRFNPLHASGHAGREDLSAIIKTVNPKRVIPVHTEHPELFKEISGDVKVELPTVDSKTEI